jgi:hypothetical protein
MAIAFHSLGAVVTLDVSYSRGILPIAKPDCEHRHWRQAGAFSNPYVIHDDPQRLCI